MKFLFIGLGSIGQKHLRNLRTLLGDNCEVIAYRARGHELVLTDQMEVQPDVSLALQYGVREFYDLEAALAETPDAVFITNPTRLHIPVAIKAARAGCHLFIEKPLSDTESDVAELIEIVESRRLVALVGYQLRFHPCLRTIKQWLQQCRIGRLISAQLEIGEYLPNWHPYEDYRKSYAARRDLGGGALVTQIHELDYAVWFFGIPTRVFALGGHLSHLEIDVEDVASVLLACQVDNDPLPVHVHLDYLQWPPVRGCVIVGEQGRIQWDYFGNRVVLIERDGNKTETHEYNAFERNQLFVDELRHFLACLRGAEAPEVNVREGAKSLRIAQAARQSMETGKVVRL